MKNLDDHGSTQKKIERKKNQEEKNGLFKKNICLSVKNKRQIVLLFYPS